ncbi:MAG: lipopolysaccharide biosynthesis protein [Syntrophobacteraceae bacterium]
MVLMSGTAFAQVITVAIAPVLTRLYAPAEFGIFGVYTAAVGIVISFVTLRYDQALMLPKSAEEAANLLGISVFCVVGVTVLSALPCFFLSSSIAAVMKSPDLVRWLWLVPISVFLSGLYQALNSWCTRQKQFHRASVSQVVRSVALSGTQIIAGIGKAGPTGLIGGAVFGVTCSFTVLGAQVLKDDYRFLRRSINVADMKRLMREYADFPMYSSTQSLLNAISQNIPLLLLAHYFGPTITGLYTLSVRVLQLPMNLLLTSLRQVLFQKASEVYNGGGNTYELFKKVTLGLLAIVIGPTMVIVLFAPQIFSFVLGQDWYGAGEYARWLIMWLSVMFANVPAILFGQIYRKQRKLLMQDVALLVCRAGAIVLGGLYFSALQTVVLYSAVGVVFNTYIILWMWQFLRHRVACETPATV